MLISIRSRHKTRLVAGWAQEFRSMTQKFLFTICSILNGFHGLLFSLLQPEICASSYPARPCTSANLAVSVSLSSRRKEGFWPVGAVKLLLPSWNWLRFGTPKNAEEGKNNGVFSYSVSSSLFCSYTIYSPSPGALSVCALISAQFQVSGCIMVRALILGGGEVIQHCFGATLNSSVFHGIVATIQFVCVCV